MMAVSRGIMTPSRRWYLYSYLRISILKCNRACTIDPLLV
jgi:hypothetical protein